MIQTVASYLSNSLRRLRLNNETPGSIVERLVADLRHFKMTDDIDVYINIGVETHVGFESRTPLGKTVLKEILVQVEMLPCPPAACEYAHSGLCIWCGNPSEA